MFEKLKGLIATGKAKAQEKLHQAKEMMGSIMRVTGVMLLAAASAGASAATPQVLVDAITNLIGGVTDGLVTTLELVVPLLVLVFGFAFAIRWVRNTVGGK